MPKFNIDGRMGQLPDIQRTYNFELWVPNIPGSDTKLTDMILRVRSAQIPQRGIEVIESNFMGQKQFFPGKATFSHQLSVEFEEFEDQKILKGMYEWFERMNIYDPKNANAGMSKVDAKDKVAQDIILKVYDVKGGKLDKSIRFKHAYPETIAETSLAYADNASVKTTVTFRFDYWILEDN